MSKKENTLYKDTEFNSKKGSLEINGQKVPDPKLHQTISFIKSAIRLAGYGLLLYSVPIAVGVLILSEIIGIVEELV